MGKMKEKFKLNLDFDLSKQTISSYLKFAYYKHSLTAIIGSYFAVFVAVLYILFVNLGLVTDRLKDEDMYRSYLPLIFAGLFFSTSILILRKNYEKYWGIIVVLCHLMVMCYMFWGTYSLYFTLKVGIGKDLFMWVIPIIGFTGCFSVLPIFSIPLLIVNYIAAILILQNYYVDFTTSVGANMAFFSIACAWVSFSRFYKEITLFSTTNLYRHACEEAEKHKLAAEEANRAKSDFIAHMSHEIRTPLNAIIGMNEMIRRDNEDPKIEEYSDKIYISSKMLLGIVNDILDISKIESGKLELSDEPYLLANALSDVYTTIITLAEDKKLPMSIHVDSDLPAGVSGDVFHVKQIFLNLMSNAVKYTKEGHVDIYVSQERIDRDYTMISFSVKDTGIGIKQEDLSKLGEKFTRLDSKANTNIVGTGLGLSITLGMLEMMGGRLEVESVYHEGSTFTAYIKQRITDDSPIGEFKPETHQARPKYTPSFVAPDKRLLIVDDNSINLKIAVKLLEQTKAVVDSAESGAEALELTKKNRYDLIFLDHFMPDMDGIETLEQIRSTQNLCKDVPAIMLTANDLAGTDDFYKNQGFIDYISKPINPRHFETVIKKALNL